MLFVYVSVPDLGFIQLLFVCDWKSDNVKTCTKIENTLGAIKPIHFQNVCYSMKDNQNDAKACLRGRRSDVESFHLQREEGGGGLL